MIAKKTFFLISVFFVLSTSTFAQEFASGISAIENTPILNDTTAVIPAETIVVLKDSLSTALDTLAPDQKMDSLVYPPPYRDWRRLGYDSAMFLGTTVIAFGVLWAMP